MRRSIVVVLAMASFVCAAKTAEREPFAQTGVKTNPPPGYASMCLEYPDECLETATEPVKIALTKGVWQDLQRINLQVNRQIKPQSDLDHWGLDEWWTFGEDGYGDCEDYTLLKRRMLIAAGYPRQALLITTGINPQAKEAENRGHAVLTVVTDKGDYILDNMSDYIKLWSYTPYLYGKRQTATNQNEWEIIQDPMREVPVASGGDVTQNPK